MRSLTVNISYKEPNPLTSAKIDLQLKELPRWDTSTTLIWNSYFAINCEKLYVSFQEVTLESTYFWYNYFRVYGMLTGSVHQTKRTNRFQVSLTYAMANKENFIKENSRPILSSQTNEERLYGLLRWNGGLRWREWSRFFSVGIW